MPLTANHYFLGIAFALVLLLGPYGAHATSYTVPSTVHMDDGNGNVLDIMPVFDDTGTMVCIGGTCTGADFLIFRISVISGSFEEILASALVVVPQDLGYFDDAGTEPTGTSTIVGGGGRFDFDTPNLTGTSERLFVNYASLATALSTQFSATPVGEVLFSENGGIIPIPEPSSAALCGIGIAALAAGRRLRRRPSTRMSR